MATRSIIGMMNEDGTVTGIYVHFDGYPENNGAILVNNYTNKNKILELLDLGNLSSLGSEIGKTHDFDDRSHSDWCTAYGRDRRENDTRAIVYKDFAEFLAEDRGQDYSYLYVNGVWECRDYDKKLINLDKFKEQAA